MDFSKRELDLISLSVFRLMIEKKALLSDEQDSTLKEMVYELEVLSSKIDHERERL